MVAMHVGILLKYIIVRCSDKKCLEVLRRSVTIICLLLWSLTFASPQKLFLFVTSLSPRSVTIICPLLGSLTFASPQELYSFCNVTLSVWHNPTRLPAVIPASCSMVVWYHNRINF